MKSSDVAFSLIWAYLGASLVGKLLYSRTLGKPSVFPAIYAVAFLLMMMASFRLWEAEKPGHGRNGAAYALLALALLVPLGPVYLLAGILVMGLTAWLVKRAISTGRARRLGIIGGIIAIALFAFGIVAFGIPLKQPWLRYTNASVPFLLAGDVLMVAIGIYPSPWLMLLGLIIAIVGTSRTVGIGVLTAYIIAGTYRGFSMESLSKRKSLIAITAILFAAMLLARYWVTRSLYPEWSLGPIGTLLYRLGSTYTVYEHLFKWGMPLGRHTILFQTDPTGYVGRLFGRSVGYTYSLFGQPAYDFGIIGLAEAVLLGVLLREADRSAVTGTFAFSLLILMTEIGIEGVFLAALAYAAFLSTRLEGGARG